MKLRFKEINKNLSTHETEITFVVVDELDKLLKSIKTKIYFKLSNWVDKRSLQANNYFWELVSKLASLFNTTDDEIYIGMLERYGIFEIIPRLNDEQALLELKKKWRLVVDMGDCEINDTTMRKMKCYYGSSTYNVQEMSKLINGIVSECEHLNIPTKDPKEIERMCENWKP